MPELPDLEVFRTTLTKNVIDKKIISIGTNAPKKIINASINDVEEATIGESIKEITRRGKHLIFELTSKAKLVIHLMLHGKFCYEKFEKEPNMTDVFWFEFEDGLQLRITDRTRWAKLELIKDGDLSSSKLLRDLGPEPFDLTLKDFKEILKKSRLGRIKPLLMDQKKIAGIGNAYTDEALWRANLNPNRSASLLSNDEMQILFNSVIEVLEWGQRKSAAEVGDSLKESKRNWMKIYRKQGQPCPTCGTKIEQSKVNQRDTFTCPNCQRQL